MNEKKSKMKGQNGSIRWKIFLFFLSFCCLLLLILWLFQTVFLQSFYTAIKLSEVEKEARSLAQLIEQGDTDAFTQTVRRRGDLQAVLWDKAGESDEVDVPFLEMHLPGFDDAQKAALYQQAVENGGAITIRYEISDAENISRPDTKEEFPKKSFAKDDEPPHAEMGRKTGEWVLHAQIVHVDGAEKLLLVSAGITPVNATVQTLRLQLYIISALMLLLAAIIALLLAKKVARPIEMLNQSAKELGKGHYEANFDASGYREIRELSQTLKTAAKELSKTEALRQELVANVSHDLRTPLTLITGYAEMMRDIPGENSPENMQVIIDEASRLSSLVGDLLQLSRLQSGVSEMHIERFNLTAEIRGIIERFQKFSAAEGYSVHMEAAGDIWVEADAARLSQVVYNFLINAMTHGGEDKSILVRQSVADGRVKIEVIDHGEGIAPEQLPYIWERYYKVEEAHKRPAMGTGLGLSIVKSILEQHPDVEYGAESQPSAGSSFWFSLPVSAD